MGRWDCPGIEALMLCMLCDCPLVCCLLLCAGVDFRVKYLDVEGKRIKLAVW
jgi:hypothetical protein